MANEDNSSQEFFQIPARISVATSGWFDGDLTVKNLKDKLNGLPDDYIVYASPGPAIPAQPIRGIVVGKRLEA